MSKLDKKITPEPLPHQLQITNLSAIPVKCTLVWDDETFEAWVDVRVGSRVKVNLWAGAKVDANQDEALIRKGVERVANDAAAYLGRTFGDMLNSREIARTALECLDEIIRKANEARRKAAR